MMQSSRKQSSKEEAVLGLIDLAVSLFKNKFDTTNEIEDEIEALEETLQVASARQKVHYLRKEGFDGIDTKQVYSRLGKCKNIRSILKSLAEFSNQEALDADIQNLCSNMGLADDEQIRVLVAVYRLYTYSGLPSKAADKLCQVLIQKPGMSDAWVARAEAFMEMGAYGLAEIHLSQPAVIRSGYVEEYQRLVREKMLYEEPTEEIYVSLTKRFAPEELFAQAKLLGVEGFLFTALTHAVAAIMSARALSLKAEALHYCISIIQQMPTASDDLLKQALSACDYGIRLNGSKLQEFSTERCKLLFKLRNFHAVFEETLLLAESDDVMNQLHRRCDKLLKYDAYTRGDSLDMYPLGRVLGSGRLFSRVRLKELWQCRQALLWITNSDDLLLISEFNCCLLSIGHFVGDIDKIIGISHAHIQIIDLRGMPLWAQRFYRWVKLSLIKQPVLQSFICNGAFYIQTCATEDQFDFCINEEEETILVKSEDVIATLAGLTGSSIKGSGRDLSVYMLGHSNIRTEIVSQFIQNFEPFPRRKITAGFLKGCNLEVGPRYLIKDHFLHRSQQSEAESKMIFYTALIAVVFGVGALSFIPKS